MPSGLQLSHCSAIAFYILVEPRSGGVGLLFHLYQNSPHFTHFAMARAEAEQRFGPFLPGPGTEPFGEMDFESWRQAKAADFKRRGWSLDSATTNFNDRNLDVPQFGDMLLYGWWAIGQPPDDSHLLIEEDDDEHV